MPKSRFLVATVALAAVIAGGLVAASSNGDAVAAVGGITWQDEFEGRAGTPVDGGKWGFDIGGSGWGNNELQYYTDSTSNVALDGRGHLAITARRENPANYQCHYGACQYTSARIKTAGKFTQRYGRFEARIKVPKGQGIWPAFWMLGDNIGGVGWPNSGEIDIMENVGKAPNTGHGTVHGPGYSGGGGIGGSRTLGAPLGDDFHNFAVDWSPDLIVWTLDGSEYFRITPASPNGRQWVFDHPFFMILNVAVGGNWPGDPDNSTSLPQTMLVDYVRVSAWDGGSSAGGNPGEGNAGSSGNALKSNYNSRCIDIPFGRPADGAALHMWDCSGGIAHQTWSFEGDGTLRSMGMCMDPAWGSNANGTTIQLANCSGNPVQRFTLSPAGDLVNISANKCVDIQDWNPDNGGRLVLWDCAGTANQKWNRG
jgi:beta-glucanase (GH16 family)